jgi:hypothetical protein
MFDFIAYMRNVATKLKDIRHSSEQTRFYRMSGIASLEEVLAKMTHGRFPAIVVEDSLEGRLVDQNSDNIQDREYYVFYIFDRVEFLNHDEREITKRKLRTIARKVKSKMLKDHLSDSNLQTSHGLINLEAGSITYRNVGPVGDNLIGLAVSFTILENPNLKYNPDDWDEFFFNLKWTNQVCVQEEPVFELAWDNLVCVQEEPEFELAWDNKICVQEYELGIGDEYEGGTIFYTLQSGDPGYEPGKTKGLIAYPEDISGTKQWGDTLQYVNETSLNIGTGAANTTRIVSVLGDYNIGDYAAKLCDDLDDGTYSDWYLPSRNELQKMQKNKNVVPGITPNGFYWSSSEYTEASSWKAWIIDFGTGTMLATYDKNNAQRVRAIRSFEIINT